MKLALTDLLLGKEIVVESDDILIMEAVDGGGTHLVFAADLGRKVSEDLPSIAAAIGVTVPKAVNAASVMELKKKR